MTGLDCVTDTDETRWTPALRRLVFTDLECERFSILVAPARLLNQLFAIKEACVKACSGAVLPPQIEVAVGMSRASMVSRRGENIPVRGIEFSVSASTSKTGLTIAVAFRNASLDLVTKCEA